MSTLVVAALAEELTHLPSGVEPLVTGVGKAVAAAGLARRLAAGPLPKVVVNVGTAGSVGSMVAGVIEIDYVTQHDFPYTAIEDLLGTRVDRAFALAPDTPPRPVREIPTGATTIATGDMFVADASAAARIAAAGIHLVDMEAFAFAATCAAFAVPFRCVKAVSDAADEDAGASWLDTIDTCARSLGDWLRCHITA